jgi:1,4-dihydroxy-2-naphthoyl-CoA hydrolase
VAVEIPFASQLGIDVTAAEPAEVRGTMPWAADLCTVGGVMHGGALIAFADTIGGICAFLNLPERASTATVESKTNFFRPRAQRVGRGDGASAPRRTQLHRRAD